MAEGSSARRIVVIGGAAAGPKAAARARRCDPAARITIVEKGSHISYSACGMPYFISRTVKKADELRSNSVGIIRNEAFFLAAKNIEVRTRTVAESIDRRAKEVMVRSLETDSSSRLPYDKLVLATGAYPVYPKLPGIDLPGVFKLHTFPDSLAIDEYLAANKVRRGVVVGAGPIGLEAAEALSARGVKVSIVEALNAPLPAILDPEMASILTHCLQDEDIKLLFGERLERFEGGQRLERVVAGGHSLEADIAIVAIGVRPEVGLARAAGLEVGPTGAIAVDEHLQTSDPDIYAGGDCTECLHLISGRKVFIPLGTTANRQGRVIGDNVCGASKTFPGVLGTFIMKAFTLNLAVTGLSERQAREVGFEVETSLSPAPDRVHYWPRARTIVVKLIAERQSGRLLGCQLIGQGDVARRVDVAATAISLGATIGHLSNLDLAYAPPFGSPIDNLVTAAHIVENKLCGLARSISPFAVKEKLERGEKFVFLDVRTPQEVAAGKIPGTSFIPLGKLRQSLDALSPDEEIVTLCAIGLRGYEAQRLLEGEGFGKVRFMDGGVTTWPYELE